MPVGTSLAETNRVTLLVENLAKQEPEITIVSAQVGSSAEVNPSDSASASSAAGPHEAVFYIGLKKKEQRTRSGDQILEGIRAKLPKIKDAKFESLSVSASFMGGAQTPIDIKLFGKDLDVLKRTATVIMDRAPQARPADGLDHSPGDASHGHGHVFRGAIQGADGRHRPRGPHGDHVPDALRHSDRLQLF